jgi:hypothetical protein
MKETIMKGKSAKKTFKAAVVLGAGLVAALLPTACSTTTQTAPISVDLMPAPGVVHTVMAPPTVD